MAGDAENLRSGMPRHLPHFAKPLPKHWEWRRLDGVCEGVFDCPHSTPVLTDEGPFVVRSQDMRSGVLRLENAARVSAATYRERIERATPRVGDLLFSREGTYFGIAAELPPETPLCLGQRMVLLRPDPSLVRTRYLRYWLNSSTMTRHMHGFRDGTVAERLNMPTIRALPVLLPSLAEQKAIEELAGVLDDKIDLNRRTNETLERIAHALFKSWFVDFDPVRAKLERRQQVGLDERAAKLFPNSLTAEGEYAIPLGWSVVPFSDTVEIIGGGTPKTSVPAYWGGTTPWFSVVDSPRDSDVFVIQTEKTITEAGLENSSARVLPRGATIITARGTVGRVALVGEPMAMNQSCYGLKGHEAGPYLTYFRARSLVAALKLRTHGSVFDTITRDTLGTVTVVRPTTQIAAAFEEAVTPYLRHIEHSLRESRTLVELRDTLLPKVLSGEVRIRRAERVVAAAI